MEGCLGYGLHNLLKLLFFQGVKFCIICKALHVKTYYLPLDLTFLLQIPALLLIVFSVSANDQRWPAKKDTDCTHRPHVK